MADNQFSLKAELISTLEKYGPQLVNAYQRVLREKNKNASGTLSKSITFDLEEKGNKIILNILAEDYIQWVDAGRRAGKFPPLAEILKWVRVRRLRLRDAPKKQPLATQQKTLAFLIARKIAKKGTKGINLYKNAIRYTDRSLHSKIIQATQKGYIKQLVNGIKQDLFAFKLTRVKVNTK